MGLVRGRQERRGGRPVHGPQPLGLDRSIARATGFVVRLIGIPPKNDRRQNQPAQTRASYQARPRSPVHAAWAVRGLRQAVFDK